MKRKIFTVLSVAILLLLSLTACGGGETVSKSPAEIADGILNSQTFLDTLTPIDMDMIANYYRIGEEELADAKVYVSGTFSTAEEIAVFKAADSDAVTAIQAAIDTRLEDLTLQFESYVPGEMAKINDPIIVTRGTTVVLVLADDTAAVSDKVDELLQ